MEYFIPISNLAGTHSVQEIGGKGSSLLVLEKNGFEVPPGIIINTKVFDKLVETSPYKTSKIIIPKWLKEELSKLWKSSFSGKSVVVRSSANFEDNKNFSFAGQFKSIVNIKDYDNFLNAIEEVYNSLFSRPIIEYCKAHSITHSKLKMAIVVQEFINGEVSGVLFTRDPITGDNFSIIEAVAGLNQGLVSGMITPTKFIIDNKSLKKLKIEKRIQNTKIIAAKNGYIETKKNNNSVDGLISSDNLKDLTKLGLKVESLYNNPQDMEWTISNGEIYILQSRAITNVKYGKRPSKNLGRSFKGYPASPGFVVGNAKIIKTGETSFNTDNLIMIAENTDTDMLSSMKSAKAIITEEGGTLSHAAIVSRELGIPCVVGIKDARKRIKEGSIIAVDGNNGYVYTSLASSEHVTINQGLDEAQLYCFDKMKKIKNGKTLFYYEKFDKNVFYYVMDPINKSAVQKMLYKRDIRFKTLVKGNQDKAALVHRYYLTLKDKEERDLYASGINTALLFDSNLLHKEIHRIISYAEKNSKILKTRKLNNKQEFINRLLAAYRAFSAYILINTMICEGYGYRNLYYRITKILRKHGIDYLHFLYNIDREQKLEEIGNLKPTEKNTLIKAIKYYEVLKTWRKDSYPIFKRMGITSESLRPLLSELTDKLNSANVEKLSHREWFVRAVKRNS